ncbi:MAG: amidohydrolase family protein [Verrucomicrobiota bacterium]
MIIRSRFVVPMGDEPIENGAVAIIGNRITDVGRFDEIRARDGGEVVDLGEQIMLPGFINAHCHLDYTMLRGAIAPQHSFTDWICAINARKAALSEEDYLASIAAGFTESKNFGTTTLVNLTAFPELISRLPRPPLRTWWGAEMIDVREAVRVCEIAQTMPLSGSGGWGLAPHAPYTASASLYSDAAEIARGRGALLTTHLSESREEMQMFRDASGPLFDFLKSIGRPMDDCGRETPLSYVLRTQEVDQRWLIAHLNELTDSDFDLLARARKFHIVHCPRSHAFFAHAPFALKKLRKLGFNICLGTDSLASNSSLSLFAEMRALRDKEPWLSAREVIEMVTIHAARAIGRSESLGQIRPGFCADLIAVPGTPSRRNLFDSIIEFESDVRWMMMDGTTFAPV